VAKKPAAWSLAAATTVLSLTACTQPGVTEGPRSIQTPMPAQLIMARGPRMGGMGGPWWARGTQAGPPGGGWGRKRHQMMQHRGTPLPAPAPEVPAAQSEGAGVFVRYCTQCHRLPDPRQHRPDDWPAVVERMRIHMRTSGPRVTSPNSSELAAILDYLSQQGDG